MSHKDGADHINVPDPLSEATPLPSNKYLAQPVLEWLRERVDKSLAGIKYGEAVAMIERLAEYEHAWHSVRGALGIEGDLSRELLVQAVASIGGLLQFQEWAEPQIHDHGTDVLEIRRLRAALERIRDYPSTAKHVSDIRTWAEMSDIARDALSGEPPYQMTASEEASFSKVFARKRIPDETKPGRLHDGATPLAKIADKLDTAEDLTDCERGCAADALRKIADADVRHIRLRHFGRLPARELPDDDLPEKASEVQK